MNDRMFAFEEAPWERFVQQLTDGDTVSASHLIALLEGEAEESVEEAFEALCRRDVCFDLSQLPRPAVTGDTGVRLRREAELVKAGKLPQALEENDPLRLYLEEIAGIPASGDIRVTAAQLAQENRAGRDGSQLCMKIVELSLSRVVQMACEYTGWGVLLLDLIQEGSLGLWQSAQQFSGQGENYEAFRDRWIQFYLCKAVIQQARANGIGQKMRQAMEDYRAVDERLLSELGRNATVAEIAEQMHISSEEAELVRSNLDSARMIQRAKAETAPEEDEEEEALHVEDTALFQSRQRILELLSGLSEADAAVLTLRFGLESGLPLSPEETGRKLGLTAEEVVSREAAALMQLRGGK